MNVRGSAWVLVAADLALFIAGSTVVPAIDVVSVILFSGLIASFGAMGSILLARVPGNRIGPMMLAVGTLPALAAAASAYTELGSAATPPWPAAGVGLTLANILFVYPIVIALIGIPLVFPDGHLPSPRFRPIVWLTVGALTVQTFVVLFGPADNDAGRVNPLAIDALTPALKILGALTSISSIIGFGGAAAAVWTRSRAGDPVVRHQTKWLVAVASVSTVAFPASFLIQVQPIADVFFFIGFFAMLGLPVGIGIAILRYHLWEIDRIVSRTISYALLTGLLAAVFAGAVIVLQAALTQLTSGDTIAVAASTLAVLTLFQPVRRRLQTAVDRRFDRARYDGQRMAAAFAERLKDEVDISAVADDLDATVRAAVRPSTVGLWVRGTGG